METLLDPATLAAYHADGAAVLRGVLPPDWVPRLRAAIDRTLARPTVNGLEFAAPGKGRFYGDYFQWLTDPDVKALVFDSPLPALARQLMGSRQVRFFYDQLLVKEPGTARRTPWHHDIPYWPIRGEQVVSLWVPFDRATPETGVVTYVKGSHRWGQWFRPATFTEHQSYDRIYATGGLPPLPDIDAEAAPFVRSLCLLPLRPGAMASLTAGDFDKRTSELTIGKDKAGEDRRIVIPAAAAELLVEQSKDKLPTAPLFMRANGKAWDKDSWKLPIAAAVAAAGLPVKATAYTLRHSTITDLVTAGLPLLTIAQISGTSAEMIEQHYGHLARGAAVKALEALAL